MDTFLGFQRGMANVMSYVYPSYGMFEIPRKALSRDPEEVNLMGSSRHSYCRDHSRYGPTANERMRYIVPPPLFGWAQTQIDPCIIMGIGHFSQFRRISLWTKHV